MANILEKIDRNYMFKIITILTKMSPDLKDYEFVHDSDLEDFYSVFENNLSYVGITKKQLHHLGEFEFAAWIRSTLLANMEIIASDNFEKKDFIFLPLNKINVYGKSKVMEWKTEFHKGVVHAVTEEDARDIVSWYDEGGTFFYDEMEMYDYDTDDKEFNDWDYTDFTIEGPINESKPKTKRILTESADITDMSKEGVFKLCKYFVLRYGDSLDYTDSVEYIYETYYKDLERLGIVKKFGDDKVSVMELLVYIFDILSNNEFTKDTKIDDVVFPELYKFDVTYERHGQTYFTDSWDRTMFATSKDMIDDMGEIIVGEYLYEEYFEAADTEYGDSDYAGDDFRSRRLGQVDRFLDRLNENEKEYLRSKLI
jgi:hypothetical protein